MGFYVRFDDLRGVNEITSQQISSWQEQLVALQESMNKIIDLETFQGATADSVKAYYSEVQALLLSAVGSTLVDFMTKYLLYWDGYYDIDEDIHTKLNEDTMTAAVTEYTTSLDNLSDSKTTLKNALDAVSDIFWVGLPSTGLLEEDHAETMELINKTKDKVVPYEDSVLNGALKDLETLIDNTRAYIREYRNGDRNIVVNYTSGDYIYDDSVYNLAVSMNAASEYQQIHQKDLEEAISQQQKVYEQLQAEYEAEIERLAQERAEQGAIQLFMGVVAVGVGIAAIVVSAGTATPAVVAGFAAVSGTCTTMYGVSEFVEGSQHVYYGLNNDPFTSAFNPVRDTIFMGNQDAYNLWGNLNMTVASICIPVGQATQGMQGVQAVKTGAQAMVKEIAVDKASELVAGYTAPAIADALNIDSVLGQTVLNMSIQMLADGAIEKGVNAAEIKIETHQIRMDAEASGKGLAGLMDETEAARYESYWTNKEIEQIKIDAETSGKGLAGLMDETDAARYNQYVQECIAGTHNNTPGLDEIGIKGWETADAKLNEHIAVERVDGDALIALRAEEMQRVQNLEEHLIIDGEASGEYGRNSILSYEEAEEIAFNAINGTKRADTVVLGKYGDGGPTAYTSVAKDMDAQYFQLDDWDELAGKYSDDEIWKINEKFLDIQTSSGREIYLSHNPADYIGDGSFYSREIQYLIDNGYEFVEEGGIWHAVR